MRQEGAPRGCRRAPHPHGPLGPHEQASWMHTHLVPFVELSYTYSSSASVAWQSLLTNIDIY